MEERLYDLEDRVQDLELEVSDLRKRLEEAPQPAERRDFPVWVIIPVVAIICGTIISIYG